MKLNIALKITMESLATTEGRSNKTRLLGRVLPRFSFHLTFCAIEGRAGLFSTSS
jgi:hypothetical protein